MSCCGRGWRSPALWPAGGCADGRRDLAGDGCQAYGVKRVCTIWGVALSSFYDARRQDARPPGRPAGRPGPNTPPQYRPRPANGYPQHENTRYHGKLTHQSTFTTSTAKSNCAKSFNSFIRLNKFMDRL